MPVGCQEVDSTELEDQRAQMCHRSPSAGLSSDFHTAWARVCRDAGTTFIPRSPQADGYGPLR